MTVEITSIVILSQSKYLHKCALQKYCMDYTDFNALRINIRLRNMKFVLNELQFVSH